MKTFSQLIGQHVVDRDHQGNPIDMQDVRLVAGEGKIAKKHIKQAVDIIKKKRLNDWLLKHR